VLPLAGSASVAELADAGVRRISLGTGFVRAALGPFLRAAREVHDQGTFACLDEPVGGNDIAAFMRGA
jgi:2-methylisocitrate lyase-like PEP mutase family enzyme